MFQPMTLLLQGLALQLSEPKIRQTAEVSSADVQEVEMVLEPHCMHIYSTYNKSLFLKEYIEDAEVSGALRLATSNIHMSCLDKQVPCCMLLAQKCCLFLQEFVNTELDGQRNQLIRVWQCWPLTLSKGRMLHMQYMLTDLMTCCRLD